MTYFVHIWSFAAVTSREVSLSWKTRHLPSSRQKHFPMKRGRKPESLTGGTGDVNPQTFVIPAVQTAADVATVIPAATPIPRYPLANGKSLVMEILKVEFKLSQPIAANSEVFIALTTNPTAAPSILLAFQDTRIIAKTDRYVVFSSAAAYLIDALIQKDDVTDDAGHGLLVATDNVYVAIYSTGTAIANRGDCRITYRFKEVTLQEYIGIVQSQQ